jgi:hypothetical protein
VDPPGCPEVMVEFVMTSPFTPPYSQTTMNPNGPWLYRRILKFEFVIDTRLMSLETPKESEGGEEGNVV